MLILCLTVLGVAVVALLIAWPNTAQDKTEQTLRLLYPYSLSSETGRYTSDYVPLGTMRRTELTSSTAVSSSDSLRLHLVPDSLQVGEVCTLEIEVVSDMGRRFFPDNPAVEILLNDVWYVVNANIGWTSDTYVDLVPGQTQRVEIRFIVTSETDTFDKEPYISAGKPVPAYETVAIRPPEGHYRLLWTDGGEEAACLEFDVGK